MNPGKTILFLALLAGVIFTGWFFGADYLLCAYLFITSLFLFSIVFRFPNNSYLLMDELKHLEHEKGNFSVNIYGMELKEATKQYPEITHFESSKLRWHDSDKLASDTQKAMYIGFGIYAFLLLGGLMVSHLVQKYPTTNGDPSQLKFYKEVYSLVILGVGIAYLFIYFFPVTTQRSKNQMVIKHSTD